MIREEWAPGNVRGGRRDEVKTGRREDLEKR